MKKWTLTLLMASLIATGFSKSVVFNLKNGTQVYYLIDQDNAPQMALLPDGSIRVNGQQYTLQEVRSFRISATDYSGAPGTQQGATGIAQIEQEQCRMEGHVRVLTADGRLVQEGENRVDLNALAPGIYLISNGSETLKIQKR